MQQTKDLKQEMFALECLSQIFYFLKVNVDTLPIIARRLPPSPVKNFVDYFHYNQTEWMRKGKKAGKNVVIGGINLIEGLERDMESLELNYLLDIICDLKQAKDYENIAAIVKEMVEVQDLSPIVANLTALIRNQKNKE